MGLRGVRGQVDQGDQKGEARLGDLEGRVGAALYHFRAKSGPGSALTRCPPGETPGESPQEMSDRVDRVIAKVRAIHAAVRPFHGNRGEALISQAEQEANSEEEIDHSDVMIFSHGHFSRCFIARWCDFPIAAGYHFASDAGGVRPSLTSSIWGFG